MTSGTGETGAGRFDESALAEQRLLVLQSEAAAGYFGEPLQFLASLELELSMRRSQGAQGVDLEAKRRTVHEYVATLEPRNAAEQATKERWLRQAAQFTVMDLINSICTGHFQYRHSARPRRRPASHTGACSNMLNDGGAIEFRFGPGMLQRGYYDNPGVSEVRLTPRPPAELEKTDKAVTERLGQIAAEYGYIVDPPSRQFNLSVYGQREVDGVTDQWPLINNPNLPDGRRTTLDVISGLCAAIEDGLPMNEER